VPVHGIDTLHRAVDDATRGLGAARGPKRFNAHLTVARLRRGANLPRVVGSFIRADFDVDEIALVQSRLRPDGAHYETLATWPTHGRRA
jgi:2'-5' RNA ligase